MLERPLGRTGHNVKLLSLGGESIFKSDELEDHKESRRIIHRALDLGINYIDTAAIYGDSEIRIGEVIADGRRDDFYLATKTNERLAYNARKQLDLSLRRLGTDHIDCWQIHHLDTLEELDRVFAKNGVIRAIEDAKKDGLIRFAGITGHADPAVLMEALKRYSFDQVLMALNAADVHIDPFQNELLPMCIDRKVGVIAMKVFSRGSMFHGIKSAADCLNYVWSLPVSTAIVGISNMEQLERNVELANDFKFLSAEEKRDLEDKIEPFADEALFFRKHGNRNWEGHEDVHALPQFVL